MQEDTQTDVSDVVESSTEPQLTEQGAEPQAAPDKQTVIEAAADYLMSADHDQLKNVPAYNKAVQTAINKALLESDRKRQQELQKQVEDAQWSNYFNQMKSDPQRFAQLMQDPVMVQRYSQVIGNPSQMAQNSEVAKRQVAGVKQVLAAHPDFQDAPISVLDAKPLPEAIMDLAMHRSEQAIAAERRELKKELKSEMEALRSELVAKFSANAPQESATTQEHIPGGADFTPEQIKGMSKEEYKANREAIKTFLLRQATQQ